MDFCYLSMRCDDYPGDNHRFFYPKIFLTRIVVNVMLLLTIIFVILTTIFFKEELAMPLYNRLKEYRARYQLNQQQLGQLAGVSRQTISLIERGDYSPSVTLALKIATIFETTVEELFTYKEDENEEISE